MRKTPFWWFHTLDLGNHDWRIAITTRIDHWRGLPLYNPFRNINPHLKRWENRGELQITLPHYSRFDRMWFYKNIIIEWRKGFQDGGGFDYPER